MSKIDPNRKKIHITSPLLPEMEELTEQIKRIWESGFVTNNGEVHQLFEKELAAYLGVKHLSLVSNGTLGLVLAMNALGVRGEVITTPFTHISTLQSILWNNTTPVFADVNRTDANLDVSKIQSIICKETKAILPVHVFGNPCDVEKLEEINQENDVKIIYDAAHCFGVNYKNKSLLEWGDISVLSFHATKVFNTIEGGAIISKNRETKELIDAMSNSGTTSKGAIIAKGLNAKMNEIQAAIGLLLLKKMTKTIEQRKIAFGKYKEQIEELDGIDLLKSSKNITPNYSYLPILINSDKYGKTRDDVFNALTSSNVLPKKYFYPLLSEIELFANCKKQNLNVAEQIANSILCLPLSHSIQESEIDFIMDVLRKTRLQ